MKTRFFIIALIGFFSATAQKNTVQAGLFLPAQSHYNFSFERQLFQRGMHHFAGKAGIAGRSFVDQLSLNLEAVYYFGNTHRLEVGLGAISGTRLYGSNSESNLQTFDAINSGVFFRVGYVYQPQNQPWLIRVGVMAETAREQVKPFNFSRSYNNYLLPYVGVGFRF